jgi:hypothetical protein
MKTHVSVTQISWLLLFTETTAVYFQKYTKYIHSVGKTQSYGMLKQVVHIITTGL